MASNDNPIMSELDVFPAWQGFLSAFVGIVAATNILLYAELGKDRIMTSPAERLGYEMGIGLGLGIGISLALYLLILKKAPRKWLWLAFISTTAAGGLSSHFMA